VTGPPTTTSGLGLPWNDMASGKQSKRRRSVAPVAPAARVRRKGERRQASPRVLAAGAVVLVLIIAAVVLGFTFGRGGGSSSSSVPSQGSLVNALPGATEVQNLLKGIPQHGNVLGRSNAPATIVEYVDLQCPYCQQFETQAMPSLIKTYVRTGKAKVELRPIAFIGSDSQLGRLAAIAAGQQNKIFNFAELLYLNQGVENSGWLNDRMITAAAASIPGVDVPRLLADRNSTATRGRAAAFDSLSTKDAVSATPTILVGKSGGSLRQVSLASPSDAQSVAAALNTALR
jgi:protein-disulfide isomerase